MTYFYLSARCRTEVAAWFAAMNYTQPDWQMRGPASWQFPVSDKQLLMSLKLAFLNTKQGFGIVEYQ